MKLEWENIESNTSTFIRRAKVFGEWLVSATEDVRVENMPNHYGFEWRTSITFIPDPKHEWK